MEAPQLARFTHAAGMRKNTDFVFDLILEGGHTCGFVGDIQAALHFKIMRSDAGWASIFIALQSLYTTKGEHEPPCRGTKIGTHTQCPGNIRRID